MEEPAVDVVGAESEPKNSAAEKLSRARWAEVPKWGALVAVGSWNVCCCGGKRVPLPPPPLSMEAGGRGDCWWSC